MGRVLVECCDPANRGVEDQSLLNIAALARSNQRVDQSGTGRRQQHDCGAFGTVAFPPPIASW
jgi:hypothetical protein